MKCSRCQQDNPVLDAQFCPRCGAPAKHPEERAPSAVSYADLQRELTEAREQQTATSEILRVISNSPADLTPVLESVARNAARLCEAEDVSIVRAESDAITILFSLGPTAAFRGQRFPTIRSATSRAIREGRTIHVPDLLADPYYETRPEFRGFAWRSALAVPLLRDGVAIGTITARRSEVRPFSDQQIKLLETFADQAVIAIENVRLFTELHGRNRDLTEALDQQTATSELLRVISSSPTDVQPVFTAMAKSAARLCGAFDAAIHLVDADVLRMVAHEGPISPDAVLPLTQGTFGGQVFRERQAMHVADMQAEVEAYPTSADFARNRGFRTILAVPLLRGAEALGIITIRRTEVRPFTDRHVELLRTFADQAVIAIENVRLFTETKEALDRQTATSEVLKVISRSAFDLQPVFETVAESAVRLCEAERAFIYRFDGELLRMAVAYNASPELREFVERNPISPGRQSASARAALERRTVHVPDALADPEYTYAVHVDPFRTIVGVPMLKGDDLVGVIVIYKLEVRPFTDQQISLLETFADQAVIAIENVRLFTELQARTTELTRSVGELRALGEVSQAVSSTLDLQTVLSTIVARATLLAAVDAGVIYEYDSEREVFQPRATERLEPDIVQVLVTAPVRKGEGATGRLAVSPEPVQFPDIHIDTLPRRARDAFVRAGYRALLAVPLLCEDHLIGGLTVVRKTPGEFPRETIELLQTFATQSALAIHNAHLFRELADKSRQLEAASQHKSEFLANMSHELRTPLNAVIGFSEVLADRMFGELNEKQEEYLKDIHDSGQHLLSLINDILDLSKIEAGRMELELTDFNLPAALDNALTLVRERAARHGIALHITVDERLEQVRADERKIRQVVLNLLSNAIKFTPEGGRIEVRAVPVDGSVEVSVSDTGVGIAPEDQEAIFEEFRQVGTAAKKVEGTGLGLALSRKFVELHGGRIWVKSQVGAGSTFTFTLPVHRGE